METLKPQKEALYKGKGIEGKEIELTADQWEQLHYYDVLIRDTQRPKTLRERWEEADKRVIERRNEKRT